MSNRLSRTAAAPPELMTDPSRKAAHGQDTPLATAPQDDRHGPTHSPKPPKPLWQRLLPMGVIAAAIAGVYVTGAHEYLSFSALAAHRDTLAAFVSNHQLLAIGLYMLAYAVAVALSLPGAAILTITGGFLFGLWIGTAATVVGATLGAIGIFLAAKTALGATLKNKAGPWMVKLEDGFKDNALSYLLVLRLVPIFPFWLVNLVPAFLNVPLRTYTIGTLFGIIPGSFVYVSVGHGLGAVFERGEVPNLSIIFSPDIIVPILGLAVLAMIPVAYKRLRTPKDTNA